MHATVHALVKQPARPHPVIYGLLLTVVLGLVALWLGRLLPLIGGPVIGILLGILVGTLARPGERYQPGICFAAKYVLQWS
ncbi:MAG: hypothetical protein WDW36_002559 [Sanguina aurantia]